MSTTTTALVIWNADAENRVKELINAGKSVPAALVQLAPKGFVSGLRAKRTAGLRANSNVIIAKLESQGYRLEGLDGQYNHTTGQFDANKHRRNGDAVCTIKLVKRAKVEVSREDAL